MMWLYGTRCFHTIEAFNLGPLDALTINGGMLNGAGFSWG
jgi:hypothetical protein